jgi:molybdopterin synthase catalytic subunit
MNPGCDVRVDSAVIDPAAVIDQFTRRLAKVGDVGAIVSFTGIARAYDDDGQPVTHLTLTGYGGMTLRSVETIAADARTEPGVIGALAYHRIGAIAAGEVIVLVAAAARHRRAAFDAADRMMDRLKTEAIFWKCEEGPRGRRWIEPRADDHAAAARWHETSTQEEA